jgi:hypothetical protein
MRSILERALTYLLNEEQDKAEQLFHQFIVERARQIHESLRQGDDVVLDENWDMENASESYFAEGEVDEDEDGDDADEELNEFAGDDDEFKPEGDDPNAMGADPAADQMGGDEMGDMADPAADPMGGDEMGDMGGEGDIESRIDHLESELDRLTQEFETLMGTEETDPGSEFGDDTGNQPTGPDDAFNADTGIDSEMEDEGYDPMMHEDEDFDDINESVVSELETVSVKMSDGEIATGKKITQNNVSPIPQKKVGERKGAKPVEINATEHSGYDREASPPVKDMKPRRNTLKHAEAPLKRMSKEGDKSAEINKLSSEGGNTRSPIGSQGTMGNRGGI